MQYIRHTVSLCILLFFGFSSCTKNLVEIEGISLLNIDMACFSFIDSQFIINDDTAYTVLLDYLKDSIACENYQLPPIDFTERSLLGKYTSGTGCTAFYWRYVYADLESQNYLYEITADIDSFSCDPYVEKSSYNFIIVPKIPADYGVIFDVQYE